MFSIDVPDTIAPYGDTFTAYLTFSRNGNTDTDRNFNKGKFTLLENFVVPRDNEIKSAISQRQNAF